jgi:hypothetical protein
MHEYIFPHIFDLNMASMPFELLIYASFKYLIRITSISESGYSRINPYSSGVGTMKNNN